MDCVIKITKGPEAGQEFRLAGAEGVVGRSGRSQVRLNAPTVSFEHAVITRNGEDFYVENLSANGTFVNEEKITGKVRLRAKDQIRFGTETVARVESVPTGAGGNRKWLVIAVIVSLVCIMIIALGNPFGETTVVSSKRAYPALDLYVQDLAAKKQLPQGAVKMLHDAWGLELARNHKDALPMWRDLSILLANEEGKMGFQEASDKHPGALLRMAHGDGKGGAPSEEEMKAGLIQFVSRLAQ